MKICVAGQGAFGQKHLDALKRIPEVEVTSLVGGNQDATAAIAKKYQAEAPVVGVTIEKGIEIRQRGNTLGSWEIAALQSAYREALEAYVR